ncbi:MAG: DMT family transporter [Gloeomargaritaceae cyanobacterium C42_A2020_066]|nr:DMT family transporter [Gloeomargaritaceae cyanobacterium C42_A2020_066]
MVPLRLVGMMVGSAACWGLGLVLSKALLHELPAGILLAVQLGTSVCLLWAMTGAAGRIPPPSWVLARVSLTGWLEPGLSYLFGLLGLALTTASQAALLGATEPLWVMGLATVILGESLPRHLQVLAGLAFLGVVLVVGATPHVSVGQHLWGDGLVLLGTLCAALYVVLSGRAVSQTHPLPLAAVQQTAGLILIGLLTHWGWTGDTTLAFSSVAWWVWVGAALSGLMQYGLAFWLYLSGLRELPVSQAALFLTLIPVFGVLGGWLFLGETLTSGQFLGAGLILGALILMQRQGLTVAGRPPR